MRAVGTPGAAIKAPPRTVAAYRIQVHPREDLPARFGALAPRRRPRYAAWQAAAPLVPPSRRRLQDFTTEITEDTELKKR